MFMCPAKTAEPIMMPFGMLTRVDPRNYVLDGAPDPCMWRGNFEGRKGRPRICSAVTVLKATQQGAKQLQCGCRLGCSRWGAHWRHLANRIEHPCAAVVRSYVKYAWPLVLLKLAEHCVQSAIFFTVLVAIVMCWGRLTKVVGPKRPSNLSRSLSWGTTVRCP